ncbi:MAG: DUF2474 domain-containing protein [Proteobacteria bacterium]|nr:DUF2474 domain-containing protein [Pseudomonadota bacterium]
MNTLRSSTRQFLWVLALWAAGIGATTAIGLLARLPL